MIHHVAMEIDDGPDGRPYLQHFVSLDGESWLPVDRAPTEQDTDADVQAVFDGRPGPEGGRFQPMRFHVRYLRHLAASDGCRVMVGQL